MLNIKKYFKETEESSVEIGRRNAEILGKKLEKSFNRIFNKK